MEFEQLEALQEQLFRLSEMAPGIDEIQAVLVAVAIGPHYIARSEWVSFILGGDEKMLSEADALVDVLESFYHETVSAIQQDEFMPIFRLWEDDSNEEEQFDPTPWCEAFNDAMNLHGEDWVSEEDEDLIMTLLPVSYFLDPELVTEQLKIENPHDLEHLESDMMDLLGSMVCNLYDYFQKTCGDDFQKKPAGHVLPFDNNGKKSES